MASLRLLCTVGGNQARLDARTEFDLSPFLPKGRWEVEAGRAQAVADRSIFKLNRPSCVLAPLGC